MTETEKKNLDPKARVAEITFGDPPIPTRYDWPSIAEQLRARPMEWALIFKAQMVSKVNAVREGRVPAVHPDRGFEVFTTNNTRHRPRTCDLWLRWNPEKDEVPE